MNKYTEKEIFQFLYILKLPNDKQLDVTTLKENYRKLCHIYHPDVAQEPLFKSGEAFKELDNAYKYLLNNIDYVNGVIEEYVNSDQTKEESESEPSEYIVKLNKVKKDKIDSLSNYFHMDDYYNEDQRRLKNILDAFINEVDEATTINMVIYLYEKYKEEIDEIINYEELEKKRHEKYIKIIKKIFIFCLLIFIYFISIFGYYQIPRIEYKVIGDEAFVVGYFGSIKDVKIKSIYRGKPVTTIGERAFSECDSLDSIIIPKSVKKIESEAFYNVTGEILFENGCVITELGDNAFYFCSGLKNITLGEGLLVIDYNTFCQSSLEFIIIPNTVVNIKDAAFSSCSLISIVIPKSVKQMGRNVFTNDNMQIFCEANEKPIGWADDWDIKIFNSSTGVKERHNPIWGYQE